MFQTALILSIILSLVAPSLGDLDLRYRIEDNIISRRTSTLSYPVRVNRENIGPVISARAAIAVDKASKKVLWKKNANSRFPIASISKLIAALVFLDTDPDLNKIFTLKKEDLAGGGVVKLKEGDSVILKDLLYAALIASDNNAANALVRASRMDKSQFVQKMNEKAKSFGMLNSRFVEPTGLNYANISTALDLVILLEEALNNPVIAPILKTKSYQLKTLNGNVYNLRNTNKLLWSYIDVVGGKTGFINESKYNLAVAVKTDEGHTVYIVVLGSKSIDDRFTDVKAVYDWVISNYRW